MEIPCQHPMDTFMIYDDNVRTSNENLDRLEICLLIYVNHMTLERLSLIMCRKKRYKAFVVDGPTPLLVVHW